MSWAIIVLCLVQVVAWTHPVGVVHQDDTAGAEAMQLLRDQYETTVGNFKSGIGDTMSARQKLEGKVFEEAGLNKPPPLPPDSPLTAHSTKATSGSRVNSKRSAESSVSSVHPSIGPDARRRFAAVDGWHKKNHRRGGAGILLEGAMSVLFVVVLVGAVILVARSAVSLSGRIVRTPVYLRSRSAGGLATTPISCWKRQAVVLLGLVVAGLGQVAPANGATDAAHAPEPGDDPLRRWLGGLVIQVPDVSFVVPVPIFGDVNASLLNLVCQDIALSAINSTDVCSDTRPRLSIAAQGVGLSCEGDWAYSQVKHPEIEHGGGKVAVKVDQANANFQMSLYRNATGAGLVSSAALDACTVHIEPKLHFEGSGPLNDVLKVFTSLIEKQLPDVIQNLGCGGLEGLVASNLTALLSEINSDMQPFLHPPRFAPANESEAGHVDLRRAALTGLLDYAIDELVAPQLNVLMGDVTHGTGELDVPGLPRTVPMTLPGLATLDVTLVSLHVGGLNSWRVPPAPGARQMFETVGPETMSLCVALDTLSVNLAFRVGVTPLNGTIKAGTLVESGTISANFTALEISSRLGLAILEDRAAALTIPERRTPSCIISIVDSASLNATRLNMSSAQIALAVLGEATERDLDQAIDSVLHVATCSFDKAIAPFLNAFLFDPAAQAVNKAFKGFRSSSADQCVPPPEEVPQFGWGGTIVAAVLFAVASSVSCCALFSQRRIFSSDLAVPPVSTNSTTVANMEDMVVRAIPPALIVQDDPMSAISAATEESKHNLSADSSLWLGIQDHVPVGMQYGMPVMLFLNAALFVASNTSSGASVAVVLTLGEERIESTSLFDFALTNSVRDMWEAKVYPLSLLIAVFSGAWPYMKILMLFACWWVPTNKMSAKFRERVLMAVDALGKWSLIDNYILVIFMVAFSFHVELSDPKQMQPPSAVDVYVNPQRGFYGFILATVLSLALTHIMLHYQRQQSSDISEDGEDDGIASALRNQAASSAMSFQSSNASESRRSARQNPIANADTDTDANADRGSTAGDSSGGLWRDILVTPMLVASIVLQLVGAYVYAFRFTFRGAAAYLLELVDPSLIETSQSLLSLGARIPGVSDPAHGSFGPLVIQAVFYMFAFVVPIVQLVVLLVLWYTPLRLRRQFQLYTTAEILHAWSALEVFVVSILAALLELQQFVGFIVDPYCAQPDFGLSVAINTVLQELNLPELRGDNKCFDVTTELDEGCWELFASSVLSVLVSRYVLYQCHDALEARTSEKLQQRLEIRQMPSHLGRMGNE